MTMLANRQGCLLRDRGWTECNEGSPDGWQQMWVCGGVSAQRRPVVCFTGSRRLRPPAVVKFARPFWETISSLPEKLEMQNEPHQEIPLLRNPGRNVL